MNAKRAIAPLLVLCLLAWVGQLQAKRMYQYVDENGIRHFTDRKPQTDQPVTERLVEVDPTSVVSARKETVGDQTRYYFTNHRDGPIEVDVALPQKTNINTTPRLPKRFVMLERGERLLLTLVPADRRRGSSFRMTYRAMLGDPQAEPKRNFAYRLPFRPGQRFYVGQGFGGTATHSDPQAHYALDISMPEGTAIVAARGGIVMHVEEDFFGNGKSLNRYGNRANHVRILHDDGSMAIYAHLKTESVVVHSGQVVAEGELLGESGNTGYSTGPHLHFAIQYNAGMKLTTIPFRFADGRGGSFAPKAEQWLVHGKDGQVQQRR